MDVILTVGFYSFLLPHDRYHVFADSAIPGDRMGAARAARGSRACAIVMEVPGILVVQPAADRVSSSVTLIGLIVALG